LERRVREGVIRSYAAGHQRDTIFRDDALRQVADDKPDHGWVTENTERGLQGDRPSRGFAR